LGRSSSKMSPSSTSHMIWSSSRVTWALL
jgi:hypothetical protein